MPLISADEYRIVRSLAHRLTFVRSREFAQLRSLIRNALLWCAGIASVELIIVPNLTEFKMLLPKLSAAPDKVEIS
jgi:hypothetical protein